MARAARFNPRRTATETRNFKELLQERIKLLANFPVKSKVKWKFGEEILTVTSHDTGVGRVKTNNGRDYHPDELEKVS